MTPRPILCVALLAGCGGGESGGDARPADARPLTDAGVSGDSNPSLGWVDFTITGCIDSVPGDADAGAAPSCGGPAPLALDFAALAPAPIEVYQWSFGDGGESADSAPGHTYATPGVYAVSLAVGGPGGTASVDRPAAVVVHDAQLGSPCSDDGQCGAGLTCACDPDAGCDPVLAHGMCTAACDGGTPCDQGVCADLDPAGGGTLEWQQSLCLVACTGDGDCPSGLACRTVRDGAAAGWVTGCFAAGVLADIGESCADPAGDPDDHLCASGSCANLGARGMCSQTCTAGSCPDGAACATFAAGSWCLASCDSGDDCAADPWLACEDPGGTGPGAFTVDQTPAPAGYCAPRRCSGPEDCGSDGACTDGYCTAP